MCDMDPDYGNGWFGLENEPLSKKMKKGSKKEQEKKSSPKKEETRDSCDKK